MDIQQSYEEALSGEIMDPTEAGESHYAQEWEGISDEGHMANTPFYPSWNNDYDHQIYPGEDRESRLPFQALMSGTPDGVETTSFPDDDQDFSEALLTPFPTMADIDFSLYDHALDVSSDTTIAVQGNSSYDLDDEQMENDEVIDTMAYGYFQHDHSQDELNLDVTGFIKHYLIRQTLQVASNANPHSILRIGECDVDGKLSSILQSARTEHVYVPKNHHFLDFFDLQGIPWEAKLGVERQQARDARDRLYRHYQNLTFRPHGLSRILPQKLNNTLFVPKSMHTKYKAVMSHFQLRNLMCAIDDQNLVYSDHHKVYQLSPYSNDRRIVLDLSQHNNSTSYASPVEITTIKVGSFLDDEIVIAGGFHAEYAMRRLHAADSPIITGLTTDNVNGITNFIEIFNDRASGLPRVGFSCNDRHLRILDCNTNAFVAEHHYPWAINCTNTSPDRRLRVMVGDSPEALIVNADTGRCEQVLRGHQDFGFACAWSPDSIHVATANQDKTVNVWDARMWRQLSIMEADVSGYRSLRFSPAGGGARCLLMAEPADRIVVVDAQLYEERVVHDFFGEIGGIDFTPDGGSFWVANIDRKFGGFMEYERRGLGQEFALKSSRCNTRDEYALNLPYEWITDRGMEDDDRVVDRWKAKEADILMRQMEDRKTRRHFPRGYRFSEFAEL